MSIIFHYLDINTNNKIPVYIACHIIIIYCTLSVICYYFLSVFIQTTDYRKQENIYKSNSHCHDFINTYSDSVKESPIVLYV